MKHDSKKSLGHHCCHQFQHTASMKIWHILTRNGSIPVFLWYASSHLIASSTGIMSSLLSSPIFLFSCNLCNIWPVGSLLMHSNYRFKLRMVSKEHSSKFEYGKNKKKKKSNLNYLNLIFKTKLGSVSNDYTVRFTELKVVSENDVT